MHKLWCIEGDLIAMHVEGEVNLNLKLDARVPAIRLVRYYYYNYTGNFNAGKMPTWRTVTS